MTIPGTNLHFAAPWALLLIILVPFAMFFARRLRTPVRPSLPTASSLPALPKSVRQRLLPLIPIARFIGLSLMLIALARPQLGIGRVQTSTDAVAIQIVVDRSGSMKYEMELDGQLLTRLDVVKRVLKDFLTGNQRDLTGRSADLIGLVAFARYAETLCPLVRDPHAVSDLAQSMNPASQRYEDGTAIGDGLSLAAARLHTAEKDLAGRTNGQSANQIRIKSKVVILLTDGEQNAGERTAEEAAAVAKDWGIRVYTIGIGAGTEAYQTISSPLFGERRVAVPSGIDEASLTAAAESTGGKYYRAQDGEALRAIYSEIDRLEKTTVRTTEFTDFDERYAPLAVAGLAVVCLELLLGSTWLRRTCA